MFVVVGTWFSAGDNAVLGQAGVVVAVRIQGLLRSNRCLRIASLPAGAGACSGTVDCLKVPVCRRERGIAVL